MKFYSVRCRRLETPRTEVFVSAFTVNSLKYFCSLVLDVGSETSFIPKLSLSDVFFFSFFHPRYLPIHQKIKATPSSENLGGNGLSLCNTKMSSWCCDVEILVPPAIRGLGGRQKKEVPPPPQFYNYEHLFYYYEQRWALCIF